MSNAFLDYIRVFAGYRRVKTGLALLLLFFLGVTEGISLLMLIPFLELAGLPGSTVPSKPGGTVGRLFQDLGITPTLASVLLIYVLLMGSYALLRYRQEVLASELTQGFTEHLRRQLYAHLSSSNWLFIARSRNADFTHVLVSCVQRVGAGTQQLLQLAVTVTLVLVQVALALLLSVPMTLFALGCALLLYLFLHPSNRRAIRTGEAIHRGMQGLHMTLHEHLTGMKVAKSHGDEKRHVAHFIRFSRGMRDENILFSRLRGRSGAIYNIGAAVAVSGYFYVAVTVMKLPAAEMLLLIYLFARLLPKISSMQQNVQQLITMLPAFKAVQELLADCLAALESISESSQERLKLTQGITVRRLCFTYSDVSPPWTLDVLDLEIPAGSITGVVGPSGAGKSTLADLLLGLLQPQHGEILIDGRPLSGETIARWRASIGYVPQETFLYHDTVRANLTWCKPDAEDDELWSVLRQAAAADFVAALPQGLDTVIGERGVLLSGGERQRLALARTLLRRPTLLLLDEATGSLDNENEAIIHQALLDLRGKLTLVIVAHRLSTVRNADRIVVLDRGRVVEAGSWRDLSSRDESRFSRILRAGQVPMP